MRKKIKNRILGRTATHRRRLLQNLTSSLLQHGAIVTTEAKAKELRGHLEPLITRAKQELTLANRRLLLQELQQKEDLQRLVQVAQVNLTRPGGYVRITRLPSKRTDGALEAKIEFVEQSVYGEKK